MDAEAGPLHLFCADLRLLWTQAGGPSLRALAAHVGLSRSQVGAILSGRIRNLPDWGVVRGLVESFRRHAAEHGRTARLSLSTGIEEFWRPRYAMVEHSSRQQPQAPAFVPHQLPPAIRHLTGRGSELAALTRLLEDPAEAVIAVVDGTAGVGKTTLAVAWAHSVADRFVDGQLYFNLRGFDPGGRPATHEEVIRAFLDALHISPHRIPSALDEQVELYRGLLAGRRMLVVLDNARDADQVRPLLPRSPTCATLVTSRNRLPGLTAGEGAHAITLRLLSHADARELLTRRIGHADPRLVDRIVSRCAGLPLALAVAAGHAALDPGLRPGEELDGGELAAVFDSSYRALSPPAARMFRLLGLHPGPDVGAHAAASLAGVPLSEARSLLADLVRANLLAQPTPGRYAFHDLLRAYAAGLDGQGENDKARSRMVDHYLHTAHEAMILLDPVRDPVVITPPRPGAIVQELREGTEAFSWLRTERTVLLKVVERVAATRRHLQTWQFAAVLVVFLDRQGHWRELRDVQRRAVEAARELGDARLEATALRVLARAERRLACNDSALEHLRQALLAFRELGDRVEEAHTQAAMSGVLTALGRPMAALVRVRRSLELFEAAGHRWGQAKAWNMLGWQQAQLGDHRAAIASCERGLALRAGDRPVEGHTRDTIGFCHHHLGDYERAIEEYRAALTIFRELGDRYNEADVLTHLGDSYDAVGDWAGAVWAWREALAILDHLGHPDAAGPLSRLQNKMREAHGEGRLIHHG